MKKNLTWEHRKNIMNKRDVSQMREISLRAKDVIVSNNGKEKPLGSKKIARLVFTNTRSCAK